MHEIELKFLINEANLTGLLRQVQTKSAKQTQLAAYYFDTKKRDLAQHNIGLRIRLEGDNWVQTMKAGGDGLAARLEHNQTLNMADVQNMIDNQALLPELNLYKTTSMAEALANFSLKKLAKQLTLQYVTDINRTTRLISDDQNQIEIAYDVGVIKHGTDEAQESRVHEIEFELLSGDTAFLFQTAKQWCKRYKLCLSTITKAERGGLLINNQAFSDPITYRDIAIDLPSDCSPFTFLQKAIQHSLLQILPNMSAMAEQSTNYRHYDALNDGLERLISTLMTAPSLSVDIDPDWQAVITDYAKRFKQLTLELKRINSEAKINRDQGLKISDRHENAIQQVISATTRLIFHPAFQLALLDLIAFTMQGETPAKKVKLAQTKLYKLFDQQFAKINKLLKKNDIKARLMGSSVSPLNDSTPENSDEALQELLITLNKLSHLNDVAKPLFAKDAKAQDNAYRAHKAQQALSSYLNQRYYQEYYLKQSKKQPKYLFHNGWFSALAARDGKRAWQALKAL